MPGLIRGMARTAAVVGTATATRNAVNRRQADKNYAAYEHAAAQSAPPPQQYAPRRSSITKRRSSRKTWSHNSSAWAPSRPRGC